MDEVTFYKIAVVGDRGVGKTSLIRKFLDNDKEVKFLPIYSTMKYLNLELVQSYIRLLWRLH